MRIRLSQMWMGSESGFVGTDEIAGRLAPARARRFIQESFNAQDLWIVAVVPDGKSLLADVLRGTITIRYAESVDQRGIAVLDREYLVMRPFWQAEKIRSLSAAELFR
jgi:hypothetical protein